MREEIEKYINEQYDTLQEYPWNEYPNFTTFKHKNNKKWFALIMDVTFEKSGDKTIVKTVQAHPTLVWTQSRGEINSEGVELFDYRVLVLEDFIEGGKYRDEIPEEIQEKADMSYKEVNDCISEEA